jgi:thioredoxin-like negative regulator of GroEL
VSSEVAASTGQLSSSAQPAPAPRRQARLVFFCSPHSGRCRRVEGFLAQVLQHRHNHETFELLRVSVERRPDLAEKFRVEQVPTICVIEGRKMVRRINNPRGSKELERELKDWLR